MTDLKQFAKVVAHYFCVLLVSPALVGYWISAFLFGRNRALEGWSQAFAPLPGLPGVYLRRAFLANVLARCHRSAEIHFGTLFSQAGTAIDANVYVGPRCHLGLVYLEKDVLLAAGVHVPSGGKTHFIDDPEVPIRNQGGIRSLVTIGEGAWIASASVVLADVGKGTVVGAGSVVTKPLPDNVVAAGSPAKVIRSRTEGGSDKMTESM
jgi:virginiamycin A acetyltransferase